MSVEFFLFGLWIYAVIFVYCKNVIKMSVCLVSVDVNCGSVANVSVGTLNAFRAANVLH